MRLRLVWIEKDSHGNRLSQREELLEGESSKSLTRNHVARLIARHHPELEFAGRIMLIDASEEPYKWHVKAMKEDSNKWVHVYADPVGEVVAVESSIVNE